MKTARILLTPLIALFMTACIGGFSQDVDIPQTMLAGGGNDINESSSDSDVPVSPDPPSLSPPTNAPPSGSAILEFQNNKSGISVALSEENGGDWATELTYHDNNLADQIIYLKSTVNIALFHNDDNTLVNINVPNRFIGAYGLDGEPNSGDEGIIYWKLDRDMQSHAYVDPPGFIQAYTTSFNLESATYDGSLKVLGAIGDNGEPWGISPANTTERFAYGQMDEFGNECHSLAFWDDDVAVIEDLEADVHLQGASDGHTMLLCVNPVTPVIQMKALTGGEFYTTPIKTYHVPKLWKRHTYLNENVEIALVNITNAETVYYRVNQGNFQPYPGTPLLVGNLFSGDNSEHTLTVKNGVGGVEMTRTITLRPDHPAPEENHGNLLWANEAGRQAVNNKITSVEPFVQSYDFFHSDWHQGLPYTPTNARGGYRWHAYLASRTLNNAFLVAMEGADQQLTLANTAKARLLKLGIYQPVGFERPVFTHSPAQDFTNNLGQSLQNFVEGAVGYDLMAAHFLDNNHPQGITPIEHLWIRDGLGKITKSILQFRSNNLIGTSSGSHWAHAHELVFTAMALAMPTYKTAYYGVSGGDFATNNDLTDANGQYWNPFPDQGATWYAAGNDPAIATPGHPNIRFPYRAESLLTNDGYWTGPNYLDSDGERYFVGPYGGKYVDVDWGGLANIDPVGRVELVEMAGYEQPFVTRTIVADHMRRLKGDGQIGPAMPNYFRRLLVGGEVPLIWDQDALIYTTQAPRIQRVIHAFNPRYNFASLPTPKARVEEFLNNLILYYNNADALPADLLAELEEDRKMFYDVYGLTLCANPATMPDPEAEPNHSPTIKPMYKYVIPAGDPIDKEIVAYDIDDDALSVQVTNLPPGAVFDSAERRIIWDTTDADEGVYIVNVTASDGSLSTTRPFPIIVKNESGPQFDGLTSVIATYNAPTQSVTLDWQAPPSTEVDHYVIYRDAAFYAVVPGTQTAFEDFETLRNTHTRYQVAFLGPNGAESLATLATPKDIFIP